MTKFYVKGLISIALFVIRMVVLDAAASPAYADRHGKHLASSNWGPTTVGCLSPTSLRADLACLSDGDSSERAK